MAGTCKRRRARAIAGHPWNCTGARGACCTQRCQDEGACEQATSTHAWRSVYAMATSIGTLPCVLRLDCACVAPNAPTRRPRVHACKMQGDAPRDSCATAAVLLLQLPRLHATCQHQHQRCRRRVHARPGRPRGGGGTWYSSCDPHAGAPAAAADAIGKGPRDSALHACMEAYPHACTTCTIRPPKPGQVSPARAAL